MADGLVKAGVEGTPQGGPLSPLLANIYLDALDKELERRGHSFCRYADDCNIYVRQSVGGGDGRCSRCRTGSGSICVLKVNTAKSGTGRVEERKFLGFRLDRERRIGVAPESIERFKTKVREMWRGSRSRTSNQLRDEWQRYSAEAGGDTSDWPKSAARSTNWRAGSERHIRKCFWQRWHTCRWPRARVTPTGTTGPNAESRLQFGRGAWPLAANWQPSKPPCQMRRYGDLAF